MPTYTPEVSRQMKTWVDKAFPKLKAEYRSIIKMCVGLPNTLPRADDYLDQEGIEPYVQRFQDDIRAAKEKADFVIFYPHVGGQFNPRPGKFSEYIVKKALEAGADAVVSSHSHMVQKAEYINSIPVAWSLGNFSMSPNSTIIAKQHLPEYGLALHLYLEGNQVIKTTVSILKAVEKRGQQLVSWPVDELYETLEGWEKARLEQDVRQVLGYLFDGKYDKKIILREYELTQ